MRKIFKSSFVLIFMHVFFASYTFALDALSEAASGIKGVANTAATEVAVDTVKGAINDFLTAKTRPTKASVSQADVEAAQQEAAKLEMALEEKNKANMQAIEDKKSAALKKAVELEEARKQRAAAKEAEKEKRRLEEEARLIKEAEDEKLAQEAEAAEQAKLAAEIEIEAKKAAEKATRRAKKAKMATDLVALKAETSQLGQDLAKAEQIIGERNAKIVELEAAFQKMKEEYAAQALEIIEANKMSNKILGKEINAPSAKKKTRTRAVRRQTRTNSQPRIADTSVY